jgi:hypothetical protein
MSITARDIKSAFPDVYATIFEAGRYYELHRLREAGFNPPEPPSVESVTWTGIRN